MFNFFTPWIRIKHAGSETLVTENLREVCIYYRYRNICWSRIPVKKMGGGIWYLDMPAW